MCLVYAVILVTFLYFFGRMFLGKIFVRGTSLCITTAGGNGVKVHSRNLSTLNLTKNIQFLSNSLDAQIDKDVKRLVGPLEPQSNNLSKSKNEKSLCVLMSYLLSKDKHFMKYCQIYLDNGFDVVTVKCDVTQVMWPENGAQVIVKDLVTFLANNPQYSSSTLVHGFSGSAYVFGELLTLINKEPEKYQRVVDAFKGQIWDSPAGFAEIASTFGSAIFPKSKILQNMVKSYAEFHMKFFRDTVTKHYDLARFNYENTYLTCPALILCSKDDPISVYSYVEYVAKEWENKGINVRLKAWDSSPHVRHMHTHPEEYRHEVDNFMRKIRLLKNPDTKNPDTKNPAPTIAS